MAIWHVLQINSINIINNKLTSFKCVVDIAVVNVKIYTNV